MDQALENLDDLLLVLNRRNVKSYSYGQDGLKLTFHPIPAADVDVELPPAEESPYVRVAEKLRQQVEAEARMEVEHPSTPYKHPSFGKLIDFDYTVED